jgi:AraC-like DNA-binding protein
MVAGEAGPRPVEAGGPRPVEQDARGIVAPEAGLAHFRLDRYPPSPGVARFVDRYWVVSWDLRGRPAHTQQVLPHPVVNVVFMDGGAIAHGVKSRVDRRTLAGAGRVLGVMFRPAGFRPFLAGPAAAITDQEVPLAEIFGPAAAPLTGRVHAAGSGEEMAAAADQFLASVIPSAPQPSETTTAIAERAAADPSLVRVDALADSAGLGVRQLQRRFSDHVGISAKALIRRYRMYEAAEQARLRRDIDWAGLAAQLGYSDQAHLSRDFSSLLGMPPGQYALACRAE